MSNEVPYENLIVSLPKFAVKDVARV